MNPTGLPELSKPLRDLNFDQKREKLKFQNFEKNSKILKNRHDYLLFSVYGKCQKNPPGFFLFTVPDNAA